MTDHITRLKEALEGVSDGTYVLKGFDVRMLRRLLEGLEQAEETSKLWELRFETLHALYQYRPATQELDTAIKAAINRQGEQQ